MYIQYLKKIPSSLIISFLSFFTLLTISSVAGAQEAAEIPAVSSEVAYVFNTFLFLISGFLVMFMAAGFCMLEAGQVRSKNTAVICLKKYRIILYCRDNVLPSRI